MGAIVSDSMCYNIYGNSIYGGNNINYGIMTKDELITKQQLRIEVLEKQVRYSNIIVKEIRGLFYNIGQPMNDNFLKLNIDQLKWCQKVIDKVDNIWFNL